MRRTLKISPDLALPVDAVTQTIVVYGGKGMGKTNFGSVLAEELSAAGQRFSVIDPVGVWWGLQYGTDGRSPGIEVLILGGTHGDIPIEPTGGAVVADLVADEEVDVIIDISRHATGKMWSVGEKVKFLTSYCTRLYERQGERRRPLMQIIDEAGRFVPQQIPHGKVQLAECVGAIEQLVELGRNVGVGVTLITQRSARMNKSVSELAECMIAFRTVGPRSVDAILDWLGEHVEKARWKDLVGQLRALPRGNALVVSPGWLEHEGVSRMRARQTFDSSATPKSGKERRVRGKGAKPDLTLYQHRMQETIERAKENDPKAMKREVADLKKQIRDLERRPAVVPEPERVEVPVLPDGFLAGFGSQVEVLRNALEGTSGVMREALEAITRTRVNGHAKPPPMEKASTATRPFARTFRATASATEPRTATSESKPLRKGARRMLEAVARRFPAPTTHAQVAQLAGLARTGGTFSTYLSDIVSGGYAVRQGVSLALTDLGWEAIGKSPGDLSPQTTEGMLALYRGVLRAGARRMLDEVMAVYPNHISIAELGDAAGIAHTGGTFSTYLSDLARAGLVDREPGLVRASDLLMDPAGAV